MPLPLSPQAWTSRSQDTREFQLARSPHRAEPRLVGGPIERSPETMLADSIDRWNCKIREEGRQEGEARLLLRLLRLRFGPLDPETEERVHSADADRLLGWSERILTAETLQDVFRD